MEETLHKDIFYNEMRVEKMTRAISKIQSELRVLTFFVLKLLIRSPGMAAQKRGSHKL